MNNFRFVDDLNMHVLVISHYYWPENFRINQLVADLVDRGIGVTVLTGHPNYPGGQYFDGYGRKIPIRERHPAGYDIVRVPVIKRGNGSSVRLALNYLSFLVSGIVFGTWMLRRQTFDVQFVFCTTPPIQGWIGIWFKWLRGTPVVQWVQDMWPESLSSTGHVGSRPVLNAIERTLSRMYRASDLILGQSRSFVRLLAPRCGEVRLGYLPNPGDRPQAAVELDFSLPGTFPVVFAGNIGRAQAISTIVRAAELLRDDGEVQFTLFGVGSALAELKQEIRRLGLTNITLAGRVPAAAMAAQLEKAAALLLTLTAHDAVSRTVPSKLQSYLAAGRPVIASANGDTAEIVEEAAAGVTATAEDGDALAAAIRRLKALPRSEREELGRNASAYYDRHFAPDVVADELKNLLENEVVIAQAQGLA